MSKKYQELSAKSSSVAIKTCNTSMYSSPNVCYLGSLEHVQGSSQGNNIDASGRYYN